MVLSLQEARPGREQGRKACPVCVPPYSCRNAQEAKTSEAVTATGLARWGWWGTEKALDQSLVTLELHVDRGTEQIAALSFSVDTFGSPQANVSSIGLLEPDAWVGLQPSLQPGQGCPNPTEAQSLGLRTSRSGPRRLVAALPGVPHSNDSESAVHRSLGDQLSQ